MPQDDLGNVRYTLEDECDPCLMRLNMVTSHTELRQFLTDPQSVRETYKKVQTLGHSITPFRAKSSRRGLGQKRPLYREPNIGSLLNNIMSIRKGGRKISIQLMFLQFKSQETQ